PRAIERSDEELAAGRAREIEGHGWAWILPHGAPPVRRDSGRRFHGIVPGMLHFPSIPQAPGRGRCALALSIAALCAAIITLPVATVAAPSATRDLGLAGADSLRLTGRYAEARTAYAALTGREPVATAIG